MENSRFTLAAGLVIFKDKNLLFSLPQTPRQFPQFSPSDLLK